jgi:hypothetical protein
MGEAIWELQGCDKDKRKGFEATGGSGEHLCVAFAGNIEFFSEKVGERGVWVFAVDFLIVHW